MCKACFNISVRERACQSGVPLDISKSYSNQNIGDVFPLNFGYSLAITNIVNTTVILTLSNTTLNILFNFQVSNNNSVVLDLPFENISYRVFIGVIATNCPCDVRLWEVIYARRNSNNKIY